MSLIPCDLINHMVGKMLKSWLRMLSTKAGKPTNKTFPSQIFNQYDHVEDWDDLILSGFLKTKMVSSQCGELFVIPAHDVLFLTIWGTCQSLKAIIRTRSQFLRVNPPSSVRWHWRSFFLAYIHLFSFSLFFLPLFFCFFSQVPKWVYWWSLPKLRNGQLLQYVHSLSVSAWIGACAVGAASLSLHLPSDST